MGRSSGGSGGGGRSDGGFSSGGRAGGGGFSSGGRSHIGGGGRSAGSINTGGRSAGSINTGGRGVNISGGSHYSRPGYGFGGHHRRRYGGWGWRGGWGRRGGGCGCSAIIGIVVVLLILAAALSLFRGPSNRNASRESSSAVSVQSYMLQRVPLDPSLSRETPWYQDNNTGAEAWVSNSVRMEEGLRVFYRKTGVRPFVLIHTKEQSSAMMYGKTDGERFAYAQELYHSLFSDEAHALFIISDDGSGNWRYDDYIGAQAKSVVDLEVVNLVYDKLDYYWLTDCDEEMLFYSAFRDAANSISTEPVENPIVAGDRP